MGLVGGIYGSHSVLFTTNVWIIEVTQEDQFLFAQDFLKQLKQSLISFVCVYFI